MRIVCINVENYKLTEGKIYNSESESRDFYKLLNDNNIGVRYAKRLFRPATIHEVDDIVEQQAPALPPPPPPRTERDLIASIAIVGGVVQFVDFDNSIVNIANYFSGTGAANSCGVIQISGINSQIQEIDAKFNLDEDDYIAIRRALFVKCIQYYIKDRLLTSFALGTLSTNTSGSDNGNEADEDMLSVLDGESILVTNSVINPNSRRSIKLWIMQRLA